MSVSALVRARGVEALRIAPGDFTFDEALGPGEDKEWAWHWLCEGLCVRLDPALAVHHSHADEGPLPTFRRTRGDVSSSGSR